MELRSLLCEVNSTHLHVLSFFNSAYLFCLTEPTDEKAVWHINYTNRASPSVLLLLLPALLPPSFLPLFHLQRVKDVIRESVQMDQWVVWIHLGFAVALEPPWWDKGLCLLKKTDLWKVADIMSICCEDRLTSGRHLEHLFCVKPCAPREYVSEQHLNRL